MKPKMLSRAFPALLALLLLLPSLAGCGRKEPGPESGTESENASGTEPTAESETKEEEIFMDKQNAVTDYLTVYGRTVNDGKKLSLYWTNSGFSLRFRGTGVSAMLEPSTVNPTYYGFLNVYVDGHFSPDATVCVKKAGTYDLITGLENGTHTVEVRKRNEAMYGASATIDVSELKIKDGQFALNPPEKPSRVIEFVGDSITSGFGNMVSDGSGAIFSTDTQDGTMTYAVLAAKALGADARVMSRSGIGFVRDASCGSFIPLYDKTCALPGQVLSDAPWDFESNPADAVVINLGTNDGGATIDGKAISDAKMTEEAVALLRLVREKNPGAVIVWAYGMMGSGRSAVFEKAVKKLNDEGDDKVAYLRFDTLNSAKEGIGVHGHPTIQTDIERGITLSALLADLLGWETDPTVPLNAEVQYAKDYWLKDASHYSEVSVKALEKAVTDAEALLSASPSSASCEEARSAIVKAHANLSKPEDVSDEYILLDDCDNIRSWSIGGTAGNETKRHISGESCIRTKGTGNIYFIKAPGNYHVEMPKDWENWYLEMWFYIDNPSAIQGGSNLEFSQVVDQIEFAWDVASLGLEPGWNHLVLKIGSAMKTNPGAFKTLENIRLFLFLDSPVTYMVDDIVLTKGKLAADRCDLDEWITEAETYLSGNKNETLEMLLPFAKEAQTHRSCEILSERIYSLLHQ